MEPFSKTKLKIALLNEEMDSLHRANGLYWSQGQSQTTSARAQYQFRQERLEVIRRELDQLRHSQTI
jgi:hypothetical protein